ncbi:MerR family transcriptional regulator [Thermoleophilia bacterium SCSIO 60948]|nr:MerR family transcriptional regulator [Thermoleophilia bacterium SCSIO 60948]
MTIDELARRTGMTVRNIRAHQSRGLLPPPEVKGRTGYYGEDHAARIELIQELQGDGFNLESIRRILEGAHPGTELLDFTRAIRAPFEEDEEPEIMPLAELIERWELKPDPKLITAAEDVGLLRILDAERTEVLSPRLFRAADELARLGVPPTVAIALAKDTQKHSRAVARSFTRLFLEHVWEPFDEAGRPEERWAEIRESIDRLRPIASEALLAIFQPAMTETVEEAFGREFGARGRSRDGSSGDYGTSHSSKSRKSSKRSSRKR